MVEQLLLDGVDVEVGGGAQRGGRAAAQQARARAAPRRARARAALRRLPRVRARAPRPRRAGAVASLRQIYLII